MAMRHVVARAADGQVTARLVRGGAALIMALGMTLLLTSCSTTGSSPTRYHPIQQAKFEIEEEKLLDVGITVFDPGNVTSKQQEEEGTSTAIRNAESHYIPYHLKGTLQKTGYWGAVRVVPGEIASVDLLVRGKILESHGETLQLWIRAVDATGRAWLEKSYSQRIDGLAYGGAVSERADPFKGLYNEIAYENWRKFSQTEMEALRKVREQAGGRIVGGIAMIAAAIVLEMAGVDKTETLRDVLVLGGGAVVIDGVNVSKGAAIHKAGIEELSDSFSADLETIIVEFEGKRIELTGTAEEQYREWRELLRRIHEDETGFGDDTAL